MSNGLEKYIIQNKEAFNTASPSANVLERLQQNIALQNKKQTKKLGIIKAIKFSIAACVIALVGIGVYFISTSNKTEIATTIPPKNSFSKTEIILPKNDETNPTVEPQKTIVPFTASTINKSANQNGEFIAQLQDMDLASNRYNAATSIINNKQIDKDIIEALCKCLNNDPNTNVRLASLESLSSFYKEPLVKKRLIESLNNQKDPIVKMSLIDVLTKHRANNLKQALQTIINDVNSPKPVKDQANQSIHTLSI